VYFQSISSSASSVRAMGASTVTLQEFARRKVPIDELPHVMSSDGAVHQSALMSYFLLAPMYGTYTKPTALKVQWFILHSPALVITLGFGVVGLRCSRSHSIGGPISAVLGHEHNGLLPTGVFKFDDSMTRL
jgi:hypothetical protein